MAVAQYPAFCDEYMPVGENLYSQSLACRRELATLFAHITYESGDKSDNSYPYGRTGLKFMQNVTCSHLDGR